MASTTDWQTRAQQKREAILNAIPKRWHLPPSTLENAPANLTGPFIHQFLNPTEIQITETPAPGILEKTTTGQWTAVSVAEAFSHRAAIAHQLTSCLTEILFDSALADAHRLDAHLAAHGKPLGPLHGLPISLKDSIDVAGTETTLGFVSWVASPHQPAKHGAAIASALRRQGALVHAKTAVPQASFAGETFSAVGGYVANPLHRTALSAGGSSGGEAALLALRGSALGLGTDIGGSIRWPAAGVGAYGLRPSVGRLPYAGIASVVGGLEALTDVRFAVGPMAVGDVRALRVAVEAILADAPWERDPLAVEMPWREAAYQETKARTASGGGLVIGIAASDGLVTPQPPVRRAVETVAAALRKAGHTVIPFEHSPGAEEALELWSAASYADLSFAHAQFRASGEPVDRLMPPAFDPDKEESKPLTTGQVQELNVRVRKYREAYLRHWGETARHPENATGRPVDVIITPVAPYSAARIGKIRYIGYPLPAVLNDQSAAVLPVITTDKDIDVVRPLEIPAEGIKDEYVTANKKVHQDYDPALYHGLPVNVQVIGRRFQEEKVLAITEYIDSLLKGSEKEGAAHRL
ncbi:ral amidase [Diaporthe amygdali]|uniref:ral amidase n=1 Tax=Phomopsis amygdali TaxID=1214568 RepID=UPI0022FDE21E|nr:ral amidase [Diaporthe amygdali]KAJ0116697.1 ral amidase [Diaporthe amygdali]